jgi:dienelactone hydrolase
VLGQLRVAAFILKAPVLADDRNHYQLFEIAPGSAPRLLAQATFMSNLEWRPGTRDWTLRADFGHGVQLYEVSLAGRVTPLLIVTPCVLVGGWEGLVRGDSGKPRLTGVLSYQWAPDGLRYWYSRVRLRSDAAQKRRTHGIVYNDAEMLGAEPADFRRAIEYAGTELHVVDVRTGADRMVSLSRNAMWSEWNFSYRRASTMWVDSSALQYDVTSAPAGVFTVTVWRLNVRTWIRQRVNGRGGKSMWTSMPIQDGFIVAKRSGASQGVFEVTAAGRTIRELARTNERNLNVIPGGGVQRGGMWAGPGGAMRIFSVSDSNLVAHSLIVVPSTRAAAMIGGIRDTLNECSFDRSLTWGICNREGVSEPPELVSIYPGTGRIRVIARPNARYDSIAPLRTEKARWRNRFGYENTGYVTFPRGYVRGRKYPAVVVTHALDATNLFAWRGFQWAFPVQVLAEDGYFVLSVNDPRPRRRGAPLPYMTGAANSSIPNLWFASSINPMAALEAAADSLVATGQVDPHEVGIAGYSAGAESVSFAISHSKTFRAASIADDAWWDAGIYWGGNSIDRYAYDNLFGGSPFDPRAYRNYLKYSASARAADIACPVLQEFSGYMAHQALELNELLLHAHVPTELVIYPNEAHILYGPRDRAMAMRRNIDWFNYWLLGKRDRHPADPNEYKDWEQMASHWKRCRAACAKETSLRRPPSPL